MLTYLENVIEYILSPRESEAHKTLHFGVWLSLARAPALGAGSRKFESCHPDYHLTTGYVNMRV